jgi:hypothetical protein
MCGIETEVAFNDLNIYAEVPFLKPIVICVTKINHFHGTCIFTEDYNVNLGRYGMILHMAATGFCVRRMWCYYSPFVPRVDSPVLRLLTAQIKHAKKTDDLRRHVIALRAFAMLYLFSK